jgi:hypothetical protein
MANEPSLEAINSFDKDANLVAGSPAVVLDISSGLKGVWDAAHEKAQYDWAKYENHQKQVADWAANHQLDWAGVMQEDVPLLQKQSTAYFQKMAQNPSKLAQIGNDPEFQQLLGNMQKSKARNSYLQTQYQFADKDPSVLTDENKKRIADFRQGGLDAPIFQFDMPKTVDLQGLSSKVLTTVEHGGIGKSKQYPSQGERVMEGEGDKAIYTGLLRRKEGGIEFDKGQYMNIGNALYDSNQPAGGNQKYSIADASKYMFNKLPDEQKEVFKKENPTNPEKAFWLKSWQEAYRPEGGKETIKDEQDPAYKRETELMLADKRQRQAIYLKNLEFGHSDKEKSEAAKGLVNITKDVLTNVDENTPAISVQGGQKEPVLSVSTDINKLFDKQEKVEIKDDAGKIKIETKTIHPDVITRTPDGEIRPIYYSRYSQSEIDNWDVAKKGEAPKVGEIKKDKNIPLYTSGEPVTTNDLMNKIVKTSGSGTSKEHLDILKQAQDILHKEGGVNKLIGKDDAPKSPAKKTISRSDIASKAKAAGYSTSEYEALLKKNGVEIK